MTRRRAWAAIICVCLWTTYGILALSAVRTKSATYDEPNHAVVGWFMLHHSDFRLSPDVPPLWEEFISLPNGWSAIHYDPNDPAYRHIQPGPEECRYTQSLLYDTAGNDGIGIVQRCRAMGLILAVALGILITVWGWKLAGPIAAVVATMLWAFDPNMLGHGPLAKNDIPMALVFAWLGFALWNAGSRLTWRSAGSLCLAIAIAPGIKLSGLVVLPVAILALLVRAMIPAAWPVFKWTAGRFTSRLAVVVALGAVAALGSYILLWASYDFRFSAAPDGLPLDTDHIYAVLREYEIAAHNGGTPPTPREIQQWTPDWSLKILAQLREHHIMPEAWIAGCYLTRFDSIHRNGYLTGERYFGGRWDYFPLAFVFKEPLATLAALALSLGAALVAIRQPDGNSHFDFRWAVVSMTLPAAIYLAAAMAADMNLGLRYIFPIFPYGFVGAGAAIASIWKPSRLARGVAIALAGALAVESAWVFPDYLAFFNVACGGWRGGYSLLDDSNLDWGQDLPLLAQWQRRHPHDHLYLVYFGLCEPSAYGIRATRLEGGTRIESFPAMPATSGVAAISATALITSNPGEFASYFRDRIPDQILGGSIYLFRFDKSMFPAH